jgi:hypothetical protein
VDIEEHIYQLDQRATPPERRRAASRHRPRRRALRAPTDTSHWRQESGSGSIRLRPAAAPTALFG